MVGRATLRMVLSSEMTSREAERTTSVHQRRSWMVLAAADMCSPLSPRITIRNGCVSLVKHIERIYATPAFRIYLALVPVALALVVAPAAQAGLRPWRPHVR